MKVLDRLILEVHYHRENSPLFDPKYVTIGESDFKELELEVGANLILSLNHELGITFMGTIVLRSKDLPRGVIVFSKDTKYNGEHV